MLLNKINIYVLEYKIIKIDYKESKWLQWLEHKKSFIEAIKELIELEYDAIGAYNSALNNLENPEYKKDLMNLNQIMSIM